MPFPLTKFFTQNCPNVEAVLDSEHLSDSFPLTDQDQNRAHVLVPVSPLQGLNNSFPAALVVDHNGDAMTTNKGEHTLLAPDDFVQPDAFLENKKIEAPVLFRGMAPLLHPVNNLGLKILPVSPSTYLDNPNTPSHNARSLARISILGSLSLFSGFSLRDGVQQSGSPISFGSAGIAYDVAASALVGAANVLGAAIASLLMGKQGRKSLLITSSKHFASGAWQAVGSALTGSPKFIHKLEHSAVNIAESLQHGGGDADDQFYEDMTFDKCFYIYGGPEQLQELRSFYEGRLKAAQRLHNVVWREFLWGGIIGAFSEGMMHPVDTLKTRIQSQSILSGSQNHNSILQMMRTVWAADGLRGFYRGVTPGITGSLATRAT
ncbi:hypothetical protein Nepgr_017490 [Nepenthes gracilis]|uniref:DUF7798 domain-containing protein n=1 Tax=Nepenthes gracilis TaxID=150966 RepID=A0AAD3SRN3_NEPGR|nr:hypothetical protein Nepgr_017490 [Nepenthes gracilis]